VTASAVLTVYCKKTPIRGSTRYFYPPKMVFDTSRFKRVVYKIFMKIVQILIKSTPYVIVKAL
jgi:hypothetical protein